MMTTLDARNITGDGVAVKLTLDEWKERFERWKAAIRDPDDFLAVPDFLQALLSTCPAGGEGVHFWFPAAAYRLARWPFRLPPQEIHDHLERTALANGRKPKAGEIADAINFVLGSQTTFRASRRKAKPKLNKAKEHEARTYRRGAQKELYARSAVRKPWTLTPFQILLRLHPVNATLAINFDKYNGHAVRLCEKAAKLLANAQTIVPHVPTRHTVPGNHRALEDFEVWSFAVTEFDSGTRDEQASKILWLAAVGLSTLKPVPALAMVVWSGGKSLQAWWDVRGRSAKDALTLINIAVTIGADPATRTMNQLVRMPNGVRRERNVRTKQSVIFLSALNHENEKQR
jgi:hypothetical protein